jgi:ABC-type glutathione transport system ATPase component
MSPPALEIDQLVIEYGGHAGLRHRPGVRAVDRVSLRVAAGEFVGLVGESGSGKTSIANAVLGLVHPLRGTISLGGNRVTGVKGRRGRQLRRGAQLIMQDPYDALDPHQSVRALIEEPMLVHRTEPSRQLRRDHVRRALERVGLVPTGDFEHRRPHELSGGQRQRAAIAACLVVNPKVLIADEPVSMLDVSVRAGILHLLDRLRSDEGTAIVMITHDLPTAAAFCDRLIVMHEGQIVEQDEPRQLIRAPQSQYTRELLAATPVLNRQPPTAIRLETRA